MGGKMKSRRHNCVIVITLLAALSIPVSLAADDDRDHHHKHHHYKLIDIGTFPGLSIYNRPVRSNGSTGTEFLQILNNQGLLVGGADTPIVNPFPNCFNPFNQSVECYTQHAFAWQKGRLTDLGTLPGGSASFAYFVSDNGLITGGSENGALDPNNGTPEFHAVLWNGSMIDLGTLGGSSSLGVGVNDAGQVTGFAQNDISDPFSLVGLGTQTRAFLWETGKLYDLHTLGGPDAFAQYVNNAGQIAGVSYTSEVPDPNTGVPPLHPFLWQKGKMTDLGTLGGSNGFLGPFLYGLNHSGEIVGVMALAGDQINHAFLWDTTKLSDLHNWTGNLGGNYSLAQGLNDAGEVVGWQTLVGDQRNHAVLWKNGTTTDLGTLHGDPCSVAEAINSFGQVVGASQSTAGGCDFFTSSFLWENGGPSVDLNSLIPPHSGWTLAGAGSINDKGEIVSRGAGPGCGDADICGHALLLLPCDENHPGIEDCDYSEVVESVSAIGVGSQPVAQNPTSANPRVSAAASSMFRSLSRHSMRRYPNFGLQPSPK
jgi:probable HAF family extracellular repeat protein